jgi:hypothetical protein
VRGNLHAAFDVAGAGNGAWSRCDTRRRKGEPTGNTNFDLNRRVSPRPYRHGEGPWQNLRSQILGAFDPKESWQFPER